MSWIWYIAVIAGVAAWYLVGRLADRERNRHLRGRPVLCWQRWIEEFYPSGAVSEEIIKDVVSLIADALGVHPTQIHPGDSFQRELSYVSTWNRIVVDDPDGGLEEVFHTLRAKYEISTQLSLQECTTVGEVIQRINSSRSQLK